MRSSLTSLTLALFVAVGLSPLVLAKRVVCVDDDGSGFVTTHEGYEREIANDDDVIVVGGDLTDCLAELEDGDELVIVAHGTESGAGFYWGGSVYRGFGDGDDEIALPDGFGDLNEVHVRFCTCWSNNDPDGPDGDDTSLIEKLREAMGGEDNDNTFEGYEDYATIQPCIAFATGTSENEQTAAVKCLLANPEWMDNPPANRPEDELEDSDGNPIETQLDAVKALLEECAGYEGAEFVLLYTKPPFESPKEVEQPGEGSTGCGCDEEDTGCGVAEPVFENAGEFNFHGRNLRVPLDLDSFSVPFWFSEGAEREGFPNPITEISMAISHDSEVIAPFDVLVQPTLDLDFFETIILDIADTGVTAEFVVTVSDTAIEFTAEKAVPLFKVEYEFSGDVSDGDRTELIFEDVGDVSNGVSTESEDLVPSFYVASTLDMYADDILTPDFLRGDADGNGAVLGIVDALYILSWGFQDAEEPGCLDTADADGNNVVFPLIDVLYLLAYAFTNGPEPPSPGPSDCGPDPDGDDDDVSCLFYTGCD